jgi:hypothetical protein
MPYSQAHESSKEAVGVFHDGDTLQGAIDELLSSGFDRADLSLVAGEETVEEKLGHMYDKVADLEDDPEAPRTVYVSTEDRGDAEGRVIGSLMYVGAVAAAGAVLASGGALASAIVAAALAGGTGGFIGSTLASLIGEHHALYLEEQLDRGGILPWVCARDTEHEARARAILQKHAAGDVHLHVIPSLAA